MDTNKILILTGPTAVGKTDVALKIAEDIPSEIINLDVGQFYEPIAIGTAKPEWKNQEVPHHLFDVIKEPKNISVVKYRELASEKIKEIQGKGKLPILVGGSGFYLTSLFFPPQQVAKTKIENLESTELWQKLAEVDPERAKEIHENDLYRLKRALAVWQSSKTKPSELEPVFNPIAPAQIVVLKMDRQELYDRINQRLGIMLEDGWLEETKNLSNEWKEFLKKKKLIGYDDIIKFQQNELDLNLDQLKEIIAQKTRKYAKRQLTYFRMLEKKISGIKKQNVLSFEWCDLTSTNLELYIKQLQKRLIKKK